MVIFTGVLPSDPPPQG